MFLNYNDTINGFVDCTGMAVDVKLITEDKIHGIERDKPFDAYKSECPQSKGSHK